MPIQIPEYAGMPFRPSNGTEGEIFMGSHCYQCIHEKFTHTQCHTDKKCEIMSNSMLFNINESGFPSEWIYDRDGWPTCTAYVNWDWDTDGNGNWNDPELPGGPLYPEDPDQLMIPFDFIDLFGFDVVVHKLGVIEPDLITA